MDVLLSVLYGTDLVAMLNIIIGLISSRWRFKIKTEENKILLKLMCVTLFACVCDPISFWVNGIASENARIIGYISNSYLYMANLACAFLWGDLLQCHFGSHPSKRKIRLLAMPMAFGCVLVIINLFLPIAFEINSLGVYSRKPGYFYFLAAFLFYIIYSFVFYFVDSNKKFFKKFFLIWLYITPILIGAVIQIFNNGYSIVWAFVSLSLTGLMTALQNEMIYQDQLTETYNRLYLDHIEQHILKQRKGKTFGAMVDINDFKGINDSYGHNEGDEALRNTAALLKKAAGNKSAVIRYAGDEFVILLHNKKEINPDEFVKKVNAIFDDYNSRSAKPYKISLSIGISAFDNNGITSVTDFIEEIDQKMYEKKREYHST